MLEGGDISDSPVPVIRLILPLGSLLAGGIEILPRDVIATDHAADKAWVRTDQMHLPIRKLLLSTHHAIHIIAGTLV